MAQYKKEATFSSSHTPEQLARMLNNEFTRLERSSAGSANITVINASASTSGSGSGGSSLTNFRAGSAAIVAAGTVVSFSSPLTGGYVLIVRAYNSSNQTIGADITAADTNGFTITPVENGTVQYCALPYS